MSRLRLRLNYANVVATLALVFAMSGGALAASKFLITSTKQIKPSVLAQLKGKTGAKGAAGAAGPAGPAGAQGPAGKDGVNGANGKDGLNGESVTSASLKAKEEGCLAGGSKFTVGGKTTTACNGLNGEPGEPGEPGPPGTTGFTKTLPPGETEMGTWGAVSLKPENPTVWFVPVSFSIPLQAGTENVHYIKIGETTSECPGNATTPRAAKGQLCVYEGHVELPEENIENKVVKGELEVPVIDSPTGEVGAGTAGAILDVLYQGPVNSNVIVTGSWAVTP